MQTPSPSPPRTRCCRICLLPMRGRSHERCQLLGFDNRQYAFRQEEDVETCSSSTDSFSSGSSSSSSATERPSGYALRSYATPPPSPPPQSSSSTGTSLSNAFATLTTSVGNTLRRTPPPSPPVYPETVLSDVSWEVPETGSFHHRNKRYVHPVPLPAPSLVPTEPISDVFTEVSVNLRAPSPGPSAVAFMQGDNESVGPCLSERVEMSRMTARPGQQFVGSRLRDDEHPDEMPFAGSSMFKREPFWVSSASSEPQKYPYWPANTPSSSTLPTMWTPYMAGDAPEFLGNAIVAVEDLIHAPRVKQSARYMLQWGPFFLAAFIGGYVAKHL